MKLAHGERHDDGSDAKQGNAEAVNQSDADTDRQHQRYCPGCGRVVSVADGGQQHAADGDGVRNGEVEPAGHHHGALAKPEHGEEQGECQQRIEIMTAQSAAMRHSDDHGINDDAERPGWPHEPQRGAIDPKPALQTSPRQFRIGTQSVGRTRRLWLSDRKERGKLRSRRPANASRTLAMCSTSAVLAPIEPLITARSRTAPSTIGV